MNEIHQKYIDKLNEIIEEAIKKDFTKYLHPKLILSDSDKAKKRFMKYIVSKLKNDFIEAKNLGRKFLNEKV